MFFQYGNYIHQTDSVALIDVDWSPRYNDRGFRRSVVKTWQIQGTLIPSVATPSGITTVANVLERAYSFNGLSAALFEDNGTRTVYFLDTNTAIGGVKVVNFAFIDGRGASYVTHLRFAATLQAEFPDAVENLMSWTETLSFVGDTGPQFAWSVPLVGQPVRQIVTQKTTQRITQSGSAVGYLSKISAPAPRWPQWFMGPQAKVSPSTPDANAGRFEGYGVSWSYEFESPVDLSGAVPAPR